MKIEKERMKSNREREKKEWKVKRMKERNHLTQIPLKLFVFILFLKLSSFIPGQYADGWLFRNTRTPFTSPFKTYQIKKLKEREEEKRKKRRTKDIKGKKMREIKYNEAEEREKERESFTQKDFIHVIHFLLYCQIGNSLLVLIWKLFQIKEIVEISRTYNEGRGLGKIGTHKTLNG